jgi:D-sedoheptulose 7-phosphate isomerase
MHKILNRSNKLENINIDFRQYVNAIDTLSKGKIVMVGGNGGSFADGQHFTAELLGRFDGQTNPLPAIHMGSNGAELTAFGNDYGYENIFCPYIEAFTTFKPSFLFISTSGTSPNIIKAINTILEIYEEKYIVLLTGGNTTEFDNNNDVKIINVNSLNTQLIQEAHSIILHDIARSLKITDTKSP